MGRLVDVDDITDSAGVAEMLRLSPGTGRNTVSRYRRQYPDFPEPVLDLGNGRCLLWYKPDVEAWMRARGR